MHSTKLFLYEKPLARAESGFKVPLKVEMIVLLTDEKKAKLSAKYFEYHLKNRKTP